MSTFDYDDARATALELLTEFGNPITLTRINSGGAYDPGAGGFAGGSTLVLNGIGVLLGFNNSEINGTEVRATDRKLLYQGDALIIGDTFDKWRVHAINNLDPDESGTILTTAQLRK